MTNQSWVYFCVARNKRTALANVTDQQIQMHTTATKAIRAEFHEYLSRETAKREASKTELPSLLIPTLDIFLEDIPGSAQEAFQWLKAKYGRKGSVYEHYTWRQFRDLRWRGDRHEEFVMQFKYLFKELSRATDLVIPQLALCQFINSLRGHEEYLRMIEPTLAEFNSKDGMYKVYNAFLALELLDEGAETFTMTTMPPKIVSVPLRCANIPKSEF